MTLQCSGEHSCDIRIPQASSAVLSDYLSNPKQVVTALLDHKKLKAIDRHRFLYLSRPYRLLTFQIQPEVGFGAFWDGQTLTVDFEQCRIRGIPGLEKALTFACKATLMPKDMLIEAKAQAELSLRQSSATAIFPDLVLLRLGRQALTLVFKRLEARCQRRLKKDLERRLKTHCHRA